MFETMKNIGTTIAVAGAITSGGWWLVKPHAEDFVDSTLKQRGYALQEQVDEANKELTEQKQAIEENNRIATETRDKIIILENAVQSLIMTIENAQ